MTYSQMDHHDRAEREREERFERTVRICPDHLIPEDACLPPVERAAPLPIVQGDQWWKDKIATDKAKYAGRHRLDQGPAVMPIAVLIIVALVVSMSGIALMTK